MFRIAYRRQIPTEYHSPGESIDTLRSDPVLTQGAPQIDPFSSKESLIAFLQNSLYKSGCAPPPLYLRERYFVDRFVCDARPPSSDLDGSPHLIRVKQFNLLAEGLSASPKCKPPFPVGLHGQSAEMSSFGGFDQIEDVDAVMDFWGYRCWRLLEEILLDPESLPDVLCVQECDHYNDFFAPALQLFGFEGIYSPKVDSPSCSFGYHSDGVAVFWRTQTFRMLSPPVLSGHGEQIKPKTAFAIVSLEHILSGKIITVATCHLKSKMSVENEATRHQQITRILQAIEDASSRFISSPNFSLGDSSANRILLIGDFNTTPPQLSSTEASILTVVPHVEAWKGGELKSAYPYNFVDGSPLYSTWKTRSNQEKKQLIDYIWYSHTHFKVISYLLPPMGEDIVNSQSKLPDTRYPSDHVSLSCWLEML